MEVVQRDREQDQQRSSSNNNKATIKWVAQPVPSNFMLEQPQGTFVMSNPQLSCFNQLGQFGQFGQGSGQMMAIQPQPFITQQSMPGYQGVMVSDQFFNGQNPSFSTRLSFQDSSTQGTSSQQNIFPHNNGLKI